MRARDYARSIARRTSEYSSRIPADWSPTNSRGQTHLWKLSSKRTRSCRWNRKIYQSKMSIKRCSSSNSQRDVTNRVCSSRRCHLMLRLTSNCKSKTKRWIKNSKKIKIAGKYCKGITILPLLYLETRYRRSSKRGRLWSTTIAGWGNRLSRWRLRMIMRRTYSFRSSRWTSK